MGRHDGTWKLSSYQVEGYIPSRFFDNHFSDVAQLVEQGFRKAQVVSSSLTVGVRKQLAKCPSLRARPVSFGQRWTGGVMKPAMKW